MNFWISIVLQTQPIPTVRFLLCTTISWSPICLVYPTSKSPVNCRHCHQKIIFRTKDDLTLKSKLTLVLKSGPQACPGWRQCHSVIFEGIRPSLISTRVSTAQWPQKPYRWSAMVIVDSKRSKSELTNILEKIDRGRASPDILYTYLLRHWD